MINQNNTSIYICNLVRTLVSFLLLFMSHLHWSSCGIPLIAASTYVFTLAAGF